jgi:hypothetical protein
VRAIVISEAFGLYKVQHDGWTTSGASMESALRKAYEKATGRPVLPGALDPREPAMSELSAADVLEVLLGTPREGGGQIHTGIESA